MTRPTRTFGVGPAGVGDGSYKAGEYNGLQKKGGFPIGNIDWRGNTMTIGTTVCELKEAPAGR